TLTAPGPGGADHTTGAARVFDYPLHRVGAIEPSKPKDHARTVAILGAAGQLGTDLVRAWGREHPSDRVVGLAHGDVEVGDPESVRQGLLAIGPQLVVNATAYNLVDAAETDPVTAFGVNATGPRNLALAARDLDAVIVHVSTDYVFSGEQRLAYVETDPVDPLNVYGVSKAA